MLLSESLLPGGSGLDGDALVLDLGGGTFDVSVVEVGEGVIETLAVAGDNCLGGADYDEAIYRHVVRCLAKQFRLPEDHLSSSDRMHLRLEATRAKIALGLEEAASVVLPDTEFGASGVRDAEVKIDRTAFRDITAPLNRRVRTCIETALRMSYRAKRELRAILCAGQGLKTFTVREILRDMLSGIPVIDSYQEGAVVRGLCWYTGVLRGEFRERLLLLDTAYRAISVKCAGSKTEAVDADFCVQAGSANSEGTFPLLAPSTTVPTFKTEHACVVGEGPVCVVLVESSTLDGEPEEHLAKIDLTDLKRGDRFEIQIDVDANRTIAVWFVMPRQKRVVGYQLNNPFCKWSVGIGPRLSHEARDFEVSPIRVL